MKNLVRILALILLLGTTIIFILKIFMIIPINYIQLIILFIIGAICLFWANWRESKTDTKK
ncbi:MAG: hypothetical protein C0597_17315 [Marinilabiliales bacterium]|nr:MAG: hypothetical protein C0597_17315 [Marinilabiliales bacterium]